MTPWIAAGWLLIPVALWVFIAQVPHAPILRPPLLPASSASTQALTLPAGDTAHPTVLGQLVIAGDHTLGPAEQSYYDTLMSRVRADGRHVESAVATWSDPLTAAIATSDDRHGAYGLVWLKGAPGSAAARSAADSVSQTIDTVPAPPGVRAYLAGPATAFQMPASPRWTTAMIIAAAILAAVALAVWRVCRPAARLSVLFATAAATLFAAVPLIYLFAVEGLLKLCPLSLSLGVVVPACAAIDFGIVTTRSYHRQRRAGSPHDHALADAYGALVRHVLIAAPVLIAMLSASLFLHTPLLRHITVPAAIGVCVALAAAGLLIPGLIGRSADSPAWTESWAARQVPQRNRRQLVVAGVTLSALVIGATAISNHNDRSTLPPEDGPFSLAQLLPDVVTIDSDHDLRNPSGLMAINGITRKLLALPGVTRVQSASAPAGMPWDQATFAYQAGHLGSEAAQRASTATAQLGPVKSLTATLDALNGAIDRARLGGSAGDFSQAAAAVGAGMQSLQRAAAAVTQSVVPIQEWMQGIPNCANNASCAAAQRLIAPYSSVLRSVTDLSHGATAMLSGSPQGTPSGGGDLLSQLQSAVGQLRALVPGISRLIDTVIPQISALATSMKGIGQTYGDNSQGSFYLPTSTINSQPYRAVRDSMFSADGHRTRLLVYGALNNPDLPLWQRPAAITGVLTVAASEIALTEQTVTVSGTGVAALQLRDLARHDATALTLCFLLATAAAAGAMAQHRRALILLAGLASAFFLAGAAVWISVTDVVVGEITWLALLLAMAIAGPLAVHHHISMADRGLDHRRFLRPANVLCLCGIAFGVALWLAPGDSLLHRAGLLTALAMGANAATNTVSRRTIMELPATLRALWNGPAPQPAPRPAPRPVAAIPAEHAAPTPPSVSADSPVRALRPPTLRPRITVETAAAHANSRRAKAILRQQHLLYLEGPVTAGQRPRVAGGFRELAPHH